MNYNKMIDVKPVFKEVQHTDPEFSLQHGRKKEKELIKEASICQVELKGRKAFCRLMI